MHDITSQLRLLHYNRDYVSLAIGDYIVSDCIDIYDHLFDKVSELMAEADSSTETKFLKTEFVYEPDQVNELIDKDKMDDMNFIYTPRVLNSVDWDSLNRKLLASEEVQYLFDRGVTERTIRAFKMCRICDVPDEYQILAGARVHPAIRVHADRTPEGYCFPVFSTSGKRVNGSICRFQNLMPEIKWCASIPCYYLYNNLHMSDYKDVEEIYICEGLFDGFAFQDCTDKHWISLSSGYFSEFQFINLMILLMEYSNVRKLHLVLDSDAIGIMSMYIARYVLDRIMAHTELTVDCYLLPTAKDPGEHFCRDGKSIDDLVLADNDMLISTYNNVKRYTEPRRFDEYLEARKNQKDPTAYDYTKKNEINVKNQ